MVSEKNVRLRKWRAANPQRVKASAHKNNRKQYYKNPQLSAQRVKAWFKKNPDKQRAKTLRKYGLSQSDFESLLTAQNGRCAICSDKPVVGARRKWDVDHCHRTGVVRGILCQLCNKGLGLFRDNPTICSRAATYLQRGGHAL